MDLTTITAWLSQYGTWGVLLAGILTLTSDYWLPWLKGRFKSTPATVSPSDDTDVTQLLALRLVQQRAKDSGCPEFQAAVRAVEKCWFDRPEPTIGAPK